MGATPEDVRRGLREFYQQFTTAPTILGKVKSVDEDNMVCVLVDSVSGQDIPNIRLRPVIDGNKSLTLIPTVGSWGLGIKLENSEQWMLIAAGEFDKWRVNIAQATLEQSASGLLVQNGTDKLSDALNLIIDAVMQIVVIEGQNPDFVKLQEAKTKIQNLLQ